MGKQPFGGPLEKIDDTSYRIPRSYKPGMQVDGVIYTDGAMIDQVRADQAPEQVANVACLPGIQGASLAMPDIHWGYGFCIGGVCATDPANGGVISPGGVGYDINCGVRLMRTNLAWEELEPRIKELTDAMFAAVPAGVGRSGKYRFKGKELDQLMRRGVAYLRDRGLATDGDVDHTEAGGCLEGAAPDRVSDRAKQRGQPQCGTLGSGNHFVEVQVVDEIFDQPAARTMGLVEGGVCVMVHSGSRGLGYQVCDDALRSLRGAAKRHGYDLPDRQLACAPAHSPEGQAYIGAMRAAANFAWCNRQLLMWQTREVFERFFGSSWERLQMQLVYDVAHNIAKLEDHQVDGETKRLWVHRKGATRAFPPGHPEVPETFRAIGQPVLIPGDMGSASWVLVGQPASMDKTFGSSCHGAGRQLSRTAALKVARGRRIDQELLEKGVVARATSRKSLAEEQPDAYKDVDLVVEVVHRAGITRKVCRTRPVAVIKG